MSDIIFDPSSSNFIEAPYACYRTLRNNSPLYYSERDKMWYTFNYELADYFYRCKDVKPHRIKPSNFPSWGSLFYQHNTSPFLLEKKARQFFNDWFVFFDDARHNSFRKIIGKFFSPKYINEVENHIHNTALTLLESLAKKSEFDCIHNFARPFAYKVLVEILGIADTHQNKIYQSTAYLGNLLLVNPNDHEKRQLDFSVVALAREFYKYINGDLKAKENKTISLLLDIHKNGELSEDEFIAQCILLTAAGESTALSIGNMLYHLNQNRELINASIPIEKLVNELLRFDGPVECSLRVITEDMKIGEYLLKKGDRIGIILGAANHDLEKFSDPESIIFNRDIQNHMSFGVGKHHCLGAFLAKKEAEVALKIIINNYPGFIVNDSDPPRIQSFGLRGFKKLMSTLKTEIAPSVI